MENNDPINDILNRHKKKLLCDLCQKSIRFWQKGVRVVIRTKEVVWLEYYHIGCLEKKGMLRRINKVKAGKWDKDPDPETSNIVH
jgi:hypothetical protein